jgi:hypothetical protein
MDNSKTIRPPRVRPKVLLWALLVCQLGGAIFFLIQAWDAERNVSAFDVDGPHEHMIAEAVKGRISTNTDVVQLRRIGINSYDLNYEFWRDKSYRLHQMTHMWLDLSFLQAFISAILAIAIYGIRDKNLARDTAPEPK